jgi:hypothetical protein
MVFSFILFCISAARLHYTTDLSDGDPLNGGRSFYGMCDYTFFLCVLCCFNELQIPLLLNCCSRRWLLWVGRLLRKYLVKK